MARTKRRSGRVAAVAALAVVALTAAACGGSSSGSSGGSGSGGSGGGSANTAGLPQGTPGQGKPAITIGTKDFPEEFLLGDLYEQALKAKGYTVTQKQNIGSSEVIDRAFQGGQIDMYPEYTGEILSSVAADTSQPTSADETFNKAKAFEEKNRNATLLPQTPFEDIDVLAVKPDFASQHGLKSIADLSKVGPAGQGVTYGAQPAAKTRFQGLVGLQKAYGLTAIQFKGIDVGVPYSALDQGSINVGDVFSTDGQLTSGKYKTLEDPKHIMGFQHVAPVIKKDVLAKLGPDFPKVLAWVNNLLTTDAIQKLNAAIQLNHQDSKMVAQKFLQANGLQTSS